MTRSIRVLATALLLSAGSTAALAGTLSTPILLIDGASQIACIANNVSGAMITVTVRLLAMGSTASNTGTCTLPPNDRSGCVVALSNTSAHCRITVAGQTQAQTQASVRGLIFTRTIASPAIVATAEAR